MTIVTPVHPHHHLFPPSLRFSKLPAFLRWVKEGKLARVWARDDVSCGTSIPLISDPTDGRCVGMGARPSLPPSPLPSLPPFPSHHFPPSLLLIFCAAWTRPENRICRSPLTCIGLSPSFPPSQAPPPPTAWACPATRRVGRSWPSTRTRARTNFNFHFIPRGRTVWPTSLRIRWVEEEGGREGGREGERGRKGGRERGREESLA